MYLTLLGTGCPSVHPDRFGSANLIYNTKTKILIDRLVKLIDEGLLTSKDIGDEIRNSLNYKKESVINKLNLVTRDEFEIQKARLDKIQEEFAKLKKKKIKKAKKS